MKKKNPEKKNTLIFNAWLSWIQLKFIKMITLSTLLISILLNITILFCQFRNLYNMNQYFLSRTSCLGYNFTCYNSVVTW